MGNIFLLLCGFYLIYLDKVNASWGTPDSNQYHIQTDEGPERYFKYQTDNGQYRKEKRLQDGTVIGTDAWIDASGYLRQKDYIADDKGYRILKSKTVFVGSDIPIQDAMKSVKNRPADSGVLVSQGPAYPPPKPPRPVAIAPQSPAPIAPPVTTTGIKAVFIRPHSQPVNTNYLPADIEQYLPPSRHYPSSTPRPNVFIPSSTPYSPLAGNDISSTPIAVYPPASTPSPLADRSQAHLPPLVIYNSDTRQPNEFDYQTPRPENSYSYQLSNDLLPPKQHYYRVVPYSTPFPHRRRLQQERRRPPYVQPITITSAAPFIERATPAPKPLVVPLSDNNLDSLPSFNRDLLEPPASYQQYQTIRRDDDHIYDGVSVTNDGFRYYLPRQYHEETNSGSSSREGSFGYIDPFGIRRVVYYNTGPGKGFVHRKNNRFVGFNATPYDPRPL
ncbi:uncharacterized protein LOC131689839 isoform X2 [Topomyia yanbarensis]|uniref:uncharacterized protein LOC131689839 isoform X2 n=1 Tax=Topomyia yanbarensis TaxID=2498891 RepID=UPI00273AF4B0|nr:uncharacterized protein LOC131689839 isoform X2 [Topomyia yanbarensis]